MKLSEQPFDKHEISYVWLPKEQKVFPGAEMGLYMGPFMPSRTVLQGTYRSTDGKTVREIAIVAEPNAYRISGVRDGQLYADVMLDQ